MGEWTQGELAELVSQRGHALVLYARQWCDAPEDIVQEALLRMLRQPRRPAHPVAWLHVTVRRLACNQRRGESRRKRYEQDHAEQRAGWFESDPHDSLDAELVTAALRRLPEVEREVVIARLWGELTFAQIAELVGTSVATAQRRYQRGLSQLRGLFPQSAKKVSDTFLG
jgi:RNA polymerase sigma-70 factor (ECF subfamily)